MLNPHPFISIGDKNMEVKLDQDSRMALRMLTSTMNRLIDAIVSLHGSIEANTAHLIELIEKGAK